MTRDRACVADGNDTRRHHVGVDAGQRRAHARKPPARSRRRAPALAAAIVATLAAACAPWSAPSPGASTPGASTAAPARPTVPPIDLAALEPGVTWAKVYDVERPAEAFALPSGEPRAPTGPGTAGHPSHFPGQAIMADVASTPGGLVAVGYVGRPWSAIGWTSADGLRWELATVDETEASFAASVASARDMIAAVGRAGRSPAAWTSPDGESWRRADVELLDRSGEAERMTAVLATPDGFIAGGSAGPELGERRARFWTSSDGRRWVPAPDDPSFAEAEVVELAPVDDGWVAIGRLGDGRRGTGAISWRSPDGRNWEPTDDEALREGLANGVARLEDGTLVAVGSDLDEREARVWLAVNAGGPWERLPAEPSRLHHGQKIRMTDVTAVPGGLLAVGNQVAVQFGTGLSWMSADGRSWTKSAVQPAWGQGEPESLAVTDELVVAVGSHGAPDNYVPTAWLTPIPSP